MYEWLGVNVSPKYIKTLISEVGAREAPAESIKPERAHDFRKSLTMFVEEIKEKTSRHGYTASDIFNCDESMVRSFAPFPSWLQPHRSGWGPQIYYSLNTSLSKRMYVFPKNAKGKHAQKLASCVLDVLVASTANV